MRRTIVTIYFAVCMQYIYCTYFSHDFYSIDSDSKCEANQTHIDPIPIICSPLNLPSLTFASPSPLLCCCCMPSHALSLYCFLMCCFLIALSLSVVASPSHVLSSDCPLLLSHCIPSLLFCVVIKLSSHALSSYHPLLHLAHYDNQLAAKKYLATAKKAALLQSLMEGKSISSAAMAILHLHVNGRLLPMMILLLLRRDQTIRTHQ